MENATCVIPWPLGVAEKCGIKKMWSRCFLMQGPQSSSLGQQLDGMGGAWYWEQGAPGWPWSLSSAASREAVKQNI